MDETVKQIQQCCLEIALDIDRVCRANDIHYSLCGGSVIGMHLYGGFIPWDDDIDLMMTRKNYDRFLKLYPAQCGSRYHLRHYSTDGAENLPALFARVEDTQTRVEEEIAGALRQGRIFVDITVFDDIPFRPVHTLMRLYAGAVYTILYRKGGMVPGRKRWKKVLLNVIPMPRTEEKTVRIYRRLENCCRRLVRTRKDGWKAELLSAAFSGILYDASLFDHYRLADFEGHRLMVIRDYMDYLYTRYGRRTFSKEPPKEAIQQMHIRKVEIL